MTNFAADLNVLLPELVLAAGALVLLLTGATMGEKSFRTITWASVVVLAVAGYALSLQTGAAHAFHGAFVVDGFARFAKALILFGSAVVLVIAPGFMASARLDRFEFPILILLSTLGMMLMVSAANFVSLYLGLELQSLSLYVLAAFQRDNVRSSEAGTKYFVLGGLSSGMMLYGITWIYGFAGTTDFATVAKVASDAAPSAGLIVGVVFLIAGLAFKVSAVPFHMWTPDVYEGAPTPVTAFLATSPKVAAMALFLRAMIVPFPHAVHQWQQVIILISAGSMILGAFAAIGQTNIKRLMAYSSIGHMGYALIGLAAGSTAGIEAVLLYMLVYLITNAGVFVVIMAMRRDGKPVETIADLAGLSRTQPRLAFALAAFMVSLAGIPPLAGFFAKFYIFLAAIAAGQYALAILGVLTSVVGAYYYWRIMKIMFFDEPARPFDRGMDSANSLVLAGATVFTLLFIVFAGYIVPVAAAAAQTLMP